MTTPTLTEARRALLEIDAEIPPFSALASVHTKIALIAAYLDSLVPLNIENNDIVTATIGVPVNYNEIVRPVRKYSRDATIGSVVPTADLRGYCSDDKFNQPSLNDVINTMMGAGPRGELRMSERYSLEPSSPIVFDAGTACPNCINHGHKQPGCEHD